MKLSHLLTVLSGLGIAFTLQLQAQSKPPAKIPETMEAVKVSEPPFIDGILSEECWKVAKPYSNFKTFIPDYGKEIEQLTTSYMAYDTENLYFAFRCLDPEPDKIKANVSARDDILKDDWICVNLDPRFDQQGLNAFYVNPLGIQSDSKFAAGNEDPSVDLVWYSAGKLMDGGYCVEVQIPLKSLRFSEKEPVSMGLLLERFVSRTGVHVGYPELDPTMGFNLLPQLLRVDYAGVKHYSLFEAIPAATYTHKDVFDGEKLAKDLRKPDLSLTLKYGITSDLVLDAAINPDFSQVESDAGQVDVNLRYQLYYPEKRPFFLEGREKFKIGATQTSVADPMYFLVHTRTIVNPIAGVKFTGNLDAKNSVALLYGADELQRDSDSSRRAFAHFPIFRYKHNLKDDGYLGLIYTGRETEANGNRVLGTDAQIRINKSTMLEYNLFGSQYTDTSGRYNSQAEGLYLHSETRNFDYGLSLKNIGKDFRVETGYIYRTGLTQASLLLKPKLYPESKFFRRFDFELFGSATYDWIYSLWETMNHGSAQVWMGGTTQVKIKYQLSNEVFLGKRFNTGGMHGAIQGRYWSWFSGNITLRRTNSIYYSSDPFQGISNRASVAIGVQPWSKFEASFSFTYSDFQRPGESDLLYKYSIERLNLTYQFNKYLFIRGILEYNGYRKSLLTDFLISFTYIPGTVCYLGYGSIFDQTAPDQPFFGGDNEPIELQRGFFLKLSYLFRR